MDKGIVVVSFGTSYMDVGRRSLGCIEENIRKHFPNYRVESAYTSNMIRAKLKKRDGLTIPRPEQAIDDLITKGIKEIYVQPLHIIPGLEYEKIQKAVVKANHLPGVFAKLGRPLLSREEDYDQVVKVMLKEIPDQIQSEGIVLMGHGTKHHANACYSMMQAKLNDCRDDIHLVNVEGYPDLDHLLPRLLKYKHITLVPFMIVAGDHVINDMAGDEPTSFKSILLKEGIPTTSLLKGAGEYEGIQKIFTRRVEELISD